MPIAIKKAAEVARKPFKPVNAKLYLHSLLFIFALATGGFSLLLVHGRVGFGTTTDDSNNFKTWIDVVSGIAIANVIAYSLAAFVELFGLAKQKETESSSLDDANKKNESWSATAAKVGPLFSLYTLVIVVCSFVYGWSVNATCGGVEGTDEERIMTIETGDDCVMFAVLLANTMSAVLVAAPAALAISHGVSVWAASANDVTDSLVWLQTICFTVVGLLQFIFPGLWQMQHILENYGPDAASAFDTKELDADFVTYGTWMAIANALLLCIVGFLAVKQKNGVRTNQRCGEPLLVGLSMLVALIYMVIGILLAEFSNDLSASKLRKDIQFSFISAISSVCILSLFLYSVAASALHVHTPNLTDYSAVSSGQEKKARDADTTQQTAFQALTIIAFVLGVGGLLHASFGFAVFKYSFVDFVNTGAKDKDAYEQLLEQLPWASSIVVAVVMVGVTGVFTKLHQEATNKHSASTWIATILVLLNCLFIAGAMIASMYLELPENSEVSGLFANGTATGRNITFTGQLSAASHMGNLTLGFFGMAVFMLGMGITLTHQTQAMFNALVFNEVAVAAIE